MNRRRDWVDQNPFDEPVKPAPLPDLPLHEMDAVGFDGLSLPIVRSGDGTVRFGDHFVVNATGVLVSGNVTETEWWAFLEGIRKITDGIQWILGDLIVHAEFCYRLPYAVIAERTGYKPETIENLAYVARNVPRSLRRDRLSFSHHVEVASEPEDMQREWLQKAAKNGWSVRELRRQMSGETLPETVSLLADKENRNRMNRVWRNIQRGTLDKIKREDIRGLELLLKELRTRL